MAAKRDLELAAVELRFLSGTSRLDDFDQDAVDERKLEEFLELGRHELPLHAKSGTDHATVFHQLRHDLFQQRGGDRESDVLCTRHHDGRDPDDPTAAIDKWSARIARVDRSVGLDQRLGARVRHVTKQAIDAGDDAAGHRLIDTHRIAEHENVVADAKSVGVAEGCHRELALSRLWGS